MTYYCEQCQKHVDPQHMHLIEEPTEGPGWQIHPGTPPKPGVWFAFSDGSAVVPFANEIDALRHAIGNGMHVKYVPFGDEDWRRRKSVLLSWIHDHQWVFAVIAIAALVLNAITTWRIRRMKRRGEL